MSDEYKTTWRQEIAREMERHGESFADCEGASPIGQEWLDAEFDRFDSVAPPFYLWTASRVYFVVCYDVAQTVASVPRGVSDEEPTYFGGRGGTPLPAVAALRHSTLARMWAKRRLGWYKGRLVQQ